MTLDRSQYFPNEAARLTLSLKNPEAQALLVVQPFLGPWNCLDLLVKSGTGMVRQSEDSACQYFQVQNADPLAKLAPGEERQTSFWSYENLPGWESVAVGPVGGVPLDPGSYGISLEGATARFDVVAPILEAGILVKASEAPERDPDTGASMIVPQFIRVFSLRFNNNSFLCKSLTAKTARPFDLTIPFAEMARAVGPFRRYATSSSPITAISVVSNSDEGITVNYSTADGVSHTLVFEGDR